jgi:hypothetical protein
MRTDAFALRHIGPRENDLQHMLKTIGVDSIERLVYETLPDDIRLKAPLQLDPAMTEYEFANHIQELGNKNKVFQSYIGLGYHQAGNCRRTCSSNRRSRSKKRKRGPIKKLCEMTYQVFPQSDYKYQYHPFHSRQNPTSTKIQLN